MEMHKAIIMAQVAMWAAVLIPGFSEKILELRGLHIGAWGYLVALIGPIATLVLCELCKIVTGIQMRMHQQRLSKAYEGGIVPENVTSSKVVVRTPVGHIVEVVAESADSITRVVSGGSSVRDVIRGESYSKLGETGPTNVSI
jgi:hypothetical protein